MNLGKAIKQIRKEKKITQNELSNLTKISQTSISQIEKGKTFPHEQNLNEICKALNTPKHILFFKSLNISDVPEKNLKLYEDFYPVLKQLFEKIFL